MPRRARPKAILGQLLVLGGAVVFVAGSVLVFMVPPPSELAKEAPKPEPLVSVSVFPRPESIPGYNPKPTPTPHPSPKKVKPSKNAPASATPTPPKASTKPVPVPSTSPKPRPKPKPAEPSTPRTGTPAVPVPTATPKPTPSQTGSGSHTADLINAKRAARGLKALTVDPALTLQAQAWSNTMAATGDFTHSTYGVLGEIIGQGYTSAESVVAAWEASPPHRAIMYGAYTKIGVGAANPGGYWTVQFG